TTFRPSRAKSTVRETEKSRGISIQNLLFVFFAYRHSLEPVHSQLVGNIRPIDREQDPIDADFFDTTTQRRIRKKATCRDIKMLAEILAKIFHRRIARKTFVNARHQERNSLS